jgi:putative ABC transport system permease protein
MRRDLRYAVRSLARRPGFALLAAALMALGIGLTTAAFGVVDALLVRPPPFDAPERIVVLSGAHRARGLAGAALSYPDAGDVRAASRTLGAVAVVRPVRATVAGGPPATRAAGARVSPEFFRVFGVRPQLGRALLLGDDAPAAGRAVVLSERARRAWFAGAAGAAGRTLALDGQRYTVVGIMPAWFDYPTGAEFWIPFVPEPFAADRGSRYLAAVGRLAPGASVAGARAELRAVAARLAAAHPAADAGWTLDATPMRDHLAGDRRPALALAAAAAALVLLIACANVAGLLLARGAARGAEFAVRRSLGAGAGHLARLALAEAAVLAAAGAAGGALLAQAAAGAVRAALPAPVPAWVSFAVEGRTLAFVAAAALSAGALAGVAPALRAARGPARGPAGGAAGGAAGRGSASVRRTRLRRGLVVAQVALAATLLAGAGLLSASLVRLRAVAPGFDPALVAAGRVALAGPRYAGPEADGPDAAARAAAARGARVQFAEAALARLRALPEVEAAGAADGLPLASGTNRFPFTVDGEPRPAPGEEPVARRVAITAGYLPALRIPVLRGRDLDARDAAGRPRVALVSAGWAARFLAGRDPVGRRLRTADGEPTTIVGVVGDVRHDALDAAGEPAVYTPFAQDPAAELTLVARAACAAAPDGCADAASLVPALRRAVADADPGVAAPSVTTMADVVSRCLAGRRVGAALGGTLATVAAVLAGAGVYALVAWRVALRRREVGIRLALGARPRDVRRLVLGEGARLAAAGTVLGLGLAALGGRAAAGLLYGVTPTDLPTLLLAGAAMLGVGALASWGPARRAARVAPASALRAE